MTWSPGGVRRAIWRRRAMARHARGLVPPPPEAFASFGDGSFIAPPARVLNPQHIHVGSDVFVHGHARLSVVPAVPGVEPCLVLGDRCHIGRFATIACVGRIEVGPDVLIADRLFIGDSFHDYADPAAPIVEQGMAPPEPVRIDAGAFLGVACVVLGGVTIGEGAYVGAGAVVIDDVPARTLVVGNPARPVRRYDADAGAWVRWG